MGYTTKTYRTDAATIGTSFERFMDILRADDPALVVGEDELNRLRLLDSTRAAVEGTVNALDQGDSTSSNADKVAAMAIVLLSEALLLNPDIFRQLVQSLPVIPCPDQL